MALPQNDPSLPTLVAPLFSDIDAVRGDHMRANNSAIWQNITYLDSKPIIPAPYTDTPINLFTLIANYFYAYGVGSGKISVLPTQVTGCPAGVLYPAIVEFSAIQLLAGFYTLKYINHEDLRTWMCNVNSGIAGDWIQLTDENGVIIYKTINLPEGSPAVTTILNDAEHENAEYFCPSSCTQMPWPTGSAYGRITRKSWLNSYPITEQWLTLRTPSSLAEWQTIYHSGTDWAGWIQTRDYNGYATAATVSAACSGNSETATLAAACSGNSETATLSAHTKGNHIAGTPSGGDIYNELIASFGVGAWEFDMKGGVFLYLTQFTITRVLHIAMADYITVRVYGSNTTPTAFDFHSADTQTYPIEATY